MKKKKTIIIITMGIVILLLAIMFLNKYTLNDILYNIQMIGVNKDIIITKSSRIRDIGGYVNTDYQYYVDLNNRKMYEIRADDVHSTFNADGLHYTMKRKSILNDYEIGKILELTKIEHDDDSNLETLDIADRISEWPGEEGYDYEIEYNNKTIALNEEDITELVKIINKMK